MHLKDLKAKAPADLVAMAEELGVEAVGTMRRRAAAFRSTPVGSQSTGPETQLTSRRSRILRYRSGWPDPTAVRSGSRRRGMLAPQGFRLGRCSPSVRNPGYVRIYDAQLPTRVGTSRCSPIRSPRRRAFHSRSSRFQAHSPAQSARPSAIDAAIWESL